ncbi:MAG: DUF624 domain-containing protein [Oscillospiraceae bacterium]|nr:DUF624 domain-containing protein [Oscillospiraceae bacterium]
MDQKNKLKSSFGRFMYAMADLLILNLLILVCSLPIITVGPALCALFTVTLKIASEEPVETLREFFSAFKSNFRQGLILGILALFAAAVVFADGVYAFSLDGPFKIVFCIVTGIVGAVWLTYVCYVFALQAKFENTVKAHIKNAFLLAFCAPGKTVLMWGILACPVLLFLFLPQYVVAYIGFLFILFGLSLPIYCNSLILKKIFDRFIPTDQSKSTEEDPEL